MYKMIYDYHTHTTFSHGKGTIEDNVKAAIAKGLKGIAISDHGPGHLTYGVKREEIKTMKAEINRLGMVYPQIKIFMAMETNIINCKNNLDMSPLELEGLDMVLAGYHYGIRQGYCISNYLHQKGFLFKEEKLRKKNTEMTVAAIENNPIKILTHPGEKAPFDIEIIGRACAKKGVLMEINNFHQHMTVEEIKIVDKLGVKFVINSDAHHPSRVGCFEEGLKRAFEAGITIDKIDNIVSTKS